jgi:small ligand-binding sensory domain FIST
MAGCLDETKHRTNGLRQHEVLTEPVDGVAMFEAVSWPVIFQRCPTTFDCPFIDADRVVITAMLDKLPPTQCRLISHELQ